MIYKKKLRALKLSFNFFKKIKNFTLNTLHVYNNMLYYRCNKKEIHKKKEEVHKDGNNLQRKRIKKNNN